MAGIVFVSNKTLLGGALFLEPLVRPVDFRFVLTNALVVSGPRPSFCDASYFFFLLRFFELSVALCCGVLLVL